MKKWLLIGSAVVIILIILLFIAVANLGPMIKKAVNTYGPKITKTEVSLGGVGVSIFSGEAKIKDFFLGNPKGFKTPGAMSVGSVLVALDKASLTKNPIIINKIEVLRPEVTYEKMKGTDNFKAILNNVNSVLGASESPKKEEPAAKEGGGKKILIRDFIVSDGKVNLAVSMLGASKSVSVPLPDIHLTNIGGENQGASPAQVFKEVVAALYEKITSPAVTDALNQEIKALGKDIGAGTESTKKELGDVTEKTKRLFGN